MTTIENIKSLSDRDRLLVLTLLAIVDEDNVIKAIHAIFETEDIRDGN